MKGIKLWGSVAVVRSAGKGNYRPEMSLGASHLRRGGDPFLDRMVVDMIRTEAMRRSFIGEHMLHSLQPEHSADDIRERGTSVAWQTRLDYHSGFPDMG